jgi:hypothetical protein
MRGQHHLWGGIDQPWLAGRHVDGSLGEQLQMPLQQRPELEAEVLLQVLELHQGLLDPLHFGVGVADDAARREFGVTQDKLGFLAGVRADLVGLELRRHQGLLERVAQLLVREQLLVEPAYLLLEFLVALAQALQLVGDLIEEQIDFLVPVPAYRALELLAPDIERCDFHSAPPSL